MGNSHGDHQEDTDLVLRIKRGDPQAFAVVINRYQKKIFGLAMGFFHDRDEAMEIVQETFARVYEKLDQFEITTCFKNWIYRISMNLCVDFYRKQKQGRRYQKALSRQEEQNPDGAQDPEAHAEGELLKESFKKIISLLPRRQKLIVVMKHYGGLKYREIADILNVSTGSVKSLHHRAVQKLKKGLVDLEGS